MRQTARQVAEVVRPDDRRGKRAQVGAEVVQVAAAAGVHVGKKQLPLGRETHARRKLQLPVARLPGALQKVSSRAGTPDRAE